MAFAAIVAAWLTSSTAHASPRDVEPIALHYEASAKVGCPTQAEFSAMLRAHTSHWYPVAEDGQAERSIRVRLDARAGETVGTMSVASQAGTLTERTISGPACAGVARALAIMVAVALDPHSDEANDANVPDEVPLPSPPTPPPSLPAEPERPPARTKPPARKAPAPAPAQWSVSVDARLETTSAVVLGALPTIGASLKVARLGAWRPSIGVGIRQSLPKERATTGGSVAFSWTVANLRVCPHELDLARIIAVAPCVEANLGVLDGTGRGFEDSRQVDMTWLDVGGSLWATLALSKHLFLSSTILVTAPLVRRPFVLTSGEVVATVPAVGVLGGLGLGAHW